MMKSSSKHSSAIKSARHRKTKPTFSQAARNLRAAFFMHSFDAQGHQMVDPISGETHCLIPFQAQVQTDPPQTIRRGPRR